MIKLPTDQQVDFLRGVVEFNVRSIVERQDAVKIETFRPNDTRVVFSVHVDHSEIGLVLGKEGVILNAIRAVTWTACKKTDLKCDVDIVTNGTRRG